MNKQNEYSTEEKHVSYEALDIPKKIGRYEILYEIDSGGMGIVFRGRDSQLDRTVAIKMLSIQNFHNRDHQLRFVQEAKIIAKLDHPNIVKIYSIEYQKENTFLIMEYLDGASLSALLKEKGKLPLKDSLQILDQLSNVLSYVHTKGIVHLDIKPSNIFILKNGNIKLMDFGISREISSVLTQIQHLDQTKQGMGTPKYMSPEQFKKEEVDHRSDIYSFGVVGYQLVTGRNLFEGSNREEFESKHLNQEPVPIQKWEPNCPKKIRNFIHQCLKKEINQRPQFLDEVTFASSQVGFKSFLKFPSNFKLYILGGMAGLIILFPLIRYCFDPAQRSKNLPPPLKLDTGLRTTSSEGKTQEDIHLQGAKEQQAGFNELNTLFETTASKGKTQEDGHLPEDAKKQGLNKSSIPDCLPKPSYAFLSFEETEALIKESSFAEYLVALTCKKSPAYSNSKALQKLLWAPGKELSHFFSLLKSEDPVLVKHIAFIAGIKNMVHAIPNLKLRIIHEKNESLVIDLLKSMGYFQDPEAENFLNSCFLKYNSIQLLQAVLPGLHGKANDKSLEKAKMVILMLEDEKDPYYIQFKAQLYLFLASNGNLCGMDFAKRSLIDGELELKEIALEILSYSENMKTLEFVLEHKRSMFRTVSLMHAFMKTKIILSTLDLKVDEKYRQMEAECDKNEVILAWLSLHLAKSGCDKKWLQSFMKRHPLRHYKDYIRAFHYLHPENPT